MCPVYVNVLICRLITRLEEDKSMCFDVEFTLNRFPVCAMHRAIDLLLERNMFDVVFPPKGNHPALSTEGGIR
jgi:hypothetical protein